MAKVKVYVGLERGIIKEIDMVMKARGRWSERADFIRDAIKEKLDRELEKLNLVITT